METIWGVMVQGAGKSGAYAGGRIMFERAQAGSSEDKSQNAVVGCSRELLCERNEPLMVAFDEAPVCVATVGLDSRFLKCNKAFCEFLGYSEDEMKRRSIEDITFPADVDVGVEDMRDIMSGAKRRAILQKRYVRSDGEVVWGEVAITLIRDQHGKPLYFVPIILDITSRKKADDALKKILDILSVTGKMAKVGGWEFDVTTGMCVGTAEVWRIFGYDSPDGGAVHMDVVSNMFSPGSKRVMDDAVRRCITKGEAFDLELELVDRGDKQRWVHANGVAKWDHDRIESISGSIQDITAHRQAEQELRQSNTALHEAMKQLQDVQKQVIQQERLTALGQMAGGVAHDFNNALVPVLGYTELLLSEPKALDDKTQATRMLEMIRAGAVNAAATVSRLREFCRQADTCKLSSVDLHRVVGETVELTRTKWKEEMAARGINIDVRMEIAPVPPVLGDEGELRQLLTNLIFNAVDAMPAGGSVTIRLYSHVSGDRVVIEVHDNGVGMSDEVKRRCLDPFFTTKTGHGVGLGLSICHGIVRRHKGSMDVQSDVGKGTRMIIQLPRMAARTTVLTGDAGAVPMDMTRRVLTPLRVLFVDDEESARLLVERYLVSDGHSVEMAADGLTGLAKFEGSRFDLVILDRAMPGMNGDYLAAAVKALSPDVPVIMLTGFGDMMNSMEEKPAGVDRVLSKPITRDALRTAMAAVTVEAPAS
ncbi:MAG: PAS domain S-box protein [bacterium]